MEIRIESQAQRIKRDLLQGVIITPIYALKKYGSFRLAARIANLRAEGFEIQTRMRYKGRKRWAEYSLIAAPKGYADQEPTAPENGGK